MRKGRIRIDLTPSERITRLRTDEEHIYAAWIQDQFSKVDSCVKHTRAGLDAYNQTLKLAQHTGMTRIS